MPNHSTDSKMNNITHLESELATVRTKKRGWTYHSKAIEF